MKVKYVIKQRKKETNWQVLVAISLSRKYLPWTFAYMGVCLLLVWLVLER